MRTKLRIFILGLCLLMTGTAFAQEIMKHPRVVELEDGLKNSAADYIKARFPESPFMVTVKVDPKWQDSKALYAQFGLDYDV